MAYLPVEGPDPTVEDAPFWDACKRRELVFQACADCGRVRHPPVPACPHCRSMRIDWRPAGTRGRLFSYTIVHHPVTEALKAHVPFNVAIVAFPDCQGVKLVSNVIDARPDEMRIAMPLDLVWQEAANGWPLPRFRKAAEGDD